MNTDKVELNKRFLNLPTDLQNIINVKCLELIKITFKIVLIEFSNTYNYKIDMKFCKCKSYDIVCDFCDFCENCEPDLYCVNCESKRRDIYFKSFNFFNNKN